MWPWSSRQALPPEAIKDIKKKAAPVRRAYSSCLKSNGGSNEPCRGLEVRLLETYSLHCCPDEVARFRECYTAIYESEEDPSTCDKHIKAMQQCLAKKGFAYPLV